MRGQVVFRVRDLPPSPDLVGPRVPEPRVPDLVSQAQKTVLKKHKAGRLRGEESGITVQTFRRLRRAMNSMIRYQS